MYFPLLRGRLFELIALRELLEKQLIGKYIIPIIEPVKPTSTLISTLSTYRERNAKIAVIRNPREGELISRLNDSENNGIKEKFYSEIEMDEFISTYYIDNKAGVDQLYFQRKKIDPNQCIAICLSKDYLAKYASIFGEDGALYTLIPDERSLRRSINDRKIILSDNFKRQERNMDYLKNEDEPFTEDNVYYSEEGFSGFSDYSIIGDYYNESGFAPLAVAIHIVYPDTDQTLRIHHFVSDSNETINDPANKFYEALGKFHEWNKEHNLSTWASNELEKLYNDRQYPGLGTVKKLSIMHHLELVSQYLEGVNRDHL